MTEPNLKRLAEFAAGFLKPYLHDDIFLEVVYKRALFYAVVDEETLFQDTFISPILMHLGKREMEKRGWFWSTTKQIGKPNEFVWSFYKNDEEYPRTAFNGNEFIAFWSAVEKAVGENK